MIDTVFEYFLFYKKYAIYRWDHITAGEYVFLLIAVGVFGYFLMLRSGNKLSH